MFIRCTESIGIHYFESKKPSHLLQFNDRVKHSLPYLKAIAHIYRIHRMLIPGVFVLIPELGPPSPSGVCAARLTLELLNSLGADWFVRSWRDGELAPLFDGTRILRHLQQQVSEKTAGLNSMAERYAERQGAVEFLKSRVNDLETATGLLREEAAQLRRSLQNRNEAVDFLTVTLKSREEAIEALNRSLSDCRVEVESMQSELHRRLTSRAWIAAQRTLSLLRPQRPDQPNSPKKTNP
jgi:hypothetical protein